MKVMKLMHLDVGEGRATAAIGIKVEEGPLEGMSHEVAYIGMSFCSPEDQFSRKKGRLIAEGRLKKGKWFYKLVLDPDQKIGLQVRSEIERSINADYDALPRWLTA